MNNTIAGRLVKELRLDKEISMSEFAKKIRISQPSLSRIENGNQEMSFSLLIKICEVLGISVSEFFIRLEETAQLLKDSLLEIDKNTVYSSLDLDGKLHKMIDELSNEQKNALFIFLFSLTK
jgi:HTH-type transcriptional regulator / antitoxin PezA